MFDRPGKSSLIVNTPNKYYEADIRYTLQMGQWLLKPIGMWLPIYGCATIKEKIISSILIIICFGFLCFVLFPAGHYIFFREKELNVKLKLFGPIGYCLTSTMKYCYFGLKASTFGQCIEHIETDWRMIDDPGHRSIMLRNVAIGRHLTTMIVLFLYTAGFSYHMALPLLSKKTIGNLTSRTLMYPGYDIFFNVTASPTYEILFGLHCFYGLTVSNIAIATCNLSATFVTHACGQIQIQMHRLESMVQVYRTQSPHCEDPLNIIVKHHMRALRFSGCVEDVLREILLMELLSSTLFICFLEYYCIMAWTDSNMVGILTYCVILVSITFNNLIFCYIGELLVDQGAKIGEACYSIDWYNLPSKNARPLLILMMMSKFPPKLTAGKMFDLSLTTFSTILKSSIAYLNLLRTIAE